MNFNNTLFVKMVMVAFGSWYSVLGHIIFYTFILVVYRNLDLFTVIASTEAIFIGIFILMAEYREELEREKRDLNRREKDRKLVREDVSLTQNVFEEINEIKKQQKKILQLIQKNNSTHTKTPIGGI